MKTSRFINIDEDELRGHVVGPMTKQQMKVFSMFALAFLLSGVASVYAHVGVTHLAVPSMAVAFGLIGQMIQETYRS